MADADSEIERQIIQLAHEWVDAIGRRDSATLDQILANDFLISGWLPQGQLADKKLYLEDCMRPMEVQEPSYRFNRWKVRAYGSTVVVNCVFSCHGIVGGKEWGGNFLFTDVWVRDGGSWRVVTRHSSPIVTPTE